MTPIKLSQLTSPAVSPPHLSRREASEAQYFSCIENFSRLAGPLSVLDICVAEDPKLWSLWMSCWSSQPVSQVSRLPLLCPPTPGLVVAGLLSIVEHPGPASVVQDVPRYFTISCSAQVSGRLNINTCNGNEVTNIYLVKTVGRPPRTDVHQGQCRTKTETDQHPGDLSAPGLSDQQEGWREIFDWWYCLMCLIRDQIVLILETGVTPPL